MGAKSTRQCFVRDLITESARDAHRKDVCKTLPAIYEHDGKTYCAIHAPNAEKSEEFQKEIQKKLSNHDYDFQGWSFPPGIQFSSPGYDKSFIFMNATFTGDITFMGVFEEELDFRYAIFEENSQLIFRYSTLKSDLDLRNVKIRGHVRFEGGESMTHTESGFIDILQLVFDGDRAWLDLQNAVIEKPEHVLFHTVRLQPSWFVNVDCRKFVFTDCRWITAEGKKVDALTEVDNVYMKNGVLFPVNPNALLTKTCLQLAENYESNKDYETSSLFWQLANESKRFQDYFPVKVWSLHWWYWLLSFYGESWKRAALCLFVLVTFFSIGYVSPFSLFVNANKHSIVVDKNANDVEKEMMAFAAEADRYQSLDWAEALFYSLRTGALQRPEPLPANIFAKGLVTFETILVPLQAALLALAIRRKFMR